MNYWTHRRNTKQRHQKSAEWSSWRTPGMLVVLDTSQEVERNRTTAAKRANKLFQTLYKTAWLQLTLADQYPISRHPGTVIRVFNINADEHWIYTLEAIKKKNNKRTLWCSRWYFLKLIVIGSPIGRFAKNPNSLFAIGLAWPKAKLWDISCIARNSR